jgi:hypothetical protein
MRQPMPTLVDIDRLQTVQHYADAYEAKGKKGVSVGYIYKLIREQKVEVVLIDGMKFIQLPEAEKPA